MKLIAVFLIGLIVFSGCTTRIELQDLEDFCQAKGYDTESAIANVDTDNPTVQVTGVSCYNYIENNEHKEYSLKEVKEWKQER